MKNKFWDLASKKSDDILAQILFNRKIKKEDWSSFLDPDFNSLFDPTLLRGMKEAVKIMAEAFPGKKIGLFGDYDADGIPGTTLLYEYLKKIGFEVFVYIPTREEGYGLNTAGIDFLQQKGAQILITIDLGVRNPREISYAQKKGMTVIVLDHHELGPSKPDCIIIDPKQRNERYPFHELSATGVVFKFIQSLNQHFGALPPSQLKWMLDLVAIATICDMVPLISENRIFAKFGLIVLKKTRRLGLQEIYEQAAISQEKIDTYTVGFQIGPRLNAPGRMAEAAKSFYLLTSTDKTEAARLALELNTINLERQKELDRVLAEARAKVLKDGLERKKVIMVSGKNWPDGVVGLVAGRLMEEYARPVIVCDHKADILKGSCRSIEGYNLVEALEQAKNYLTKYGGHKKAAGITLESKHLSNLYDKLLEVAESKLKDKDLTPKISIDAKVQKQDLTLSLYQKVMKLAPFGLGNPRPVFLLESAKISDLRTVGRDARHLKFKVEGISAIGFDLGQYKDQLKEAADLVFTLDEDRWDGRAKLQLKILDLKGRGQ